MACAVTRAGSKDKSDSVEEKEDCDVELDLQVPQSHPVSQPELITEQRADASLSDMFAQVKPKVDFESAPFGYFLQGGVLVNKWMPQGVDCVGDPVIQIVVPTKYCEEVLKSSHDQTGHFGVNKTYRNILHYFFWPWLKHDVTVSIQMTE